MLLHVRSRPFASSFPALSFLLHTLERSRPVRCKQSSSVPVVVLCLVRWEYRFAGGSARLPVPVLAYLLYFRPSFPARPLFLFRR